MTAAAARGSSARLRRAVCVAAPGGKLIDGLSHKYTGGPYPGLAGLNPPWVIAKITPQKVATSGPDA